MNGIPRGSGRHFWLACACAVLVALGAASIAAGSPAGGHLTRTIAPVPSDTPIPDSATDDSDGDQRPEMMAPGLQTYTPIATLTPQGRVVTVASVPHSPQPLTPFASRPPPRSR